MVPFVRWIWLLAFGLVGLESLPALANSTLSRYAIVIGHNKPESPKDKALRYADDDAVAMYRLLRDAQVESRLLVTLDKDSQARNSDLRPFGPASLAALWRAFSELRPLMQKKRDEGGRVEFLLFYSGHGDVDAKLGEGYVVFKEGRLGRTDLFRRILSVSPANTNHVIIDACKSYFLVFNKGPSGQRSAYHQSFDDPTDPEIVSNTGFVLSTSSFRDSHEWERFQAGIFSHEIRSALRGSADLNFDARISYAELGAFLHTANEAIRNERYRPDFIIQPPGNSPENLNQDLLAWGQDAKAIVLDKQPLGHVYVENATGDRLIDVHPADTAQPTLYLPVESPLFLRWVNESREVVIPDIKIARLSNLPVRDYQIVRKGSLQLAFRKLFAVPFGKQSLQSFSERYQAQSQFRAQALRIRAKRSHYEDLETITMWTSLSSTAVGVTLSLVSLGIFTYGSLADVSHLEKTELNETIRKLNVASIPFYVVGGMAALTWWRVYSQRSAVDASIQVLPSFSPDNSSVGIWIQGVY